MAGLRGTTSKRARSINSDSVPVLVASGWIQQHHGRYEQAVRDLNRALQVDPGNTAALRRLARVYQETNRPEEAVAAYRKGIGSRSGDYRYYNDLGTFYFFRNKFTRAEEQYRRVVQLAPRSRKRTNEPRPVTAQTVPASGSRAGTRGRSENSQVSVSSQ